MERIEIIDEKLSDRVNRIVKRLREYYPDGKVYSLDSSHKSLSNDIGEVWKAVGYQSRNDFLDAYGFEFVRSPGLQIGRPISVDAEQVLAEIAARYEGKPKPKTTDTLLAENPDLKGKLKTLQNKSKEYFGVTFAKELKRRGLLSIGGADAKACPSTDDIQETLDKLVAKYATSHVKPSNIARLKEENPEDEPAIDGFIAKCKDMYGMTPKKKLISLGICARGARETAEPVEPNEESIEDFMELIDELGDAFCSLPPQERPATVNKLIDACPERGDSLQEGIQRGVVSKKRLQQLGILAPTQTLIKQEGVRCASVCDILPHFLGATNMAYVEPDDKAPGTLPPFVCGYDAEYGVELRTMLISITGAPAKRISLDDKVSARISFHSGEINGTPCPVLRLKTESASNFRPILLRGVNGKLSHDAIDESPSTLARFVGATVVSKSSYRGKHLLQLEYRYLGELRRETLVYMLRGMGIVTDTDIKGDMAWRFRLLKAARETATQK